MANEFMRLMAERVGTGLASRADASGNHAFSTTIVDSYAQAGQVVPAEMQNRIRELNDITQSEVLIGQASPTARAMLRGTGYDALGRRQRVAQLEQDLMNGSADVRNLATRLENERSAEQVRALELTNRMDEGTFDSQLALTLSNNELQIRRNTVEHRGIDQGMAADEAFGAAMASGAQYGELQDAYLSGDAATLRTYFGTTDRRAAHGALAAFGVAQTEREVHDTTIMANAVTRQALTIASDGQYSTEYLMQVAGGQVEMPEGWSMLAVGEALAERNGIEQSRAQLVGNNLQLEQNAAELATVVAGAQSPLESLHYIGEAIGADPQALLEALSGDPMAATQIAAALDGMGPLAITTRNGTTAQVDPLALLNSVVERLDTRREQATMAIMTNQRLRQFQTEMRETDRVVSTMTAMASHVPTEARMAMEASIHEASMLFSAAAREQDPVRRAAIVETAQNAMQIGRDQLARAMQNAGAPAYVVEDIVQGRFSSAQSVKAAQVDFVGYSDASTPNNFGAAMRNVMQARGINSADIARWQAEGESSLTELGHPGWFGSESRITEGDIVGIMEESAAAAAGNVMVSAILNSPWAQALGPEFDQVLYPLVDNELNIGAQERMRRISRAIAIGDQMLVRQQEAAARTGQDWGLPPYRQGGLMRITQDAINSSEDFTEFLSGNRTGIPDRATAGFLTEYIRITQGAGSYGENAPAFEDLIPRARQAISTSFSQLMAGQALSDTGQIQLSARMRAQQYMGMGQSGIGALGIDQQNPAVIEARTAVEMAVMRIHAQFISNQEGTNSWSQAIGRGIAAVMFGDPPPQQIDAELQAMGYDPAAIRATFMNTRVGE